MIDDLNDLWRYRLNDSTWTWVSGDNIVNQRGVYGVKGVPSTSNVPGSRREAVGWYDSSRQEFWLFGGWGNDVNISGSGASSLVDKFPTSNPLNPLIERLNDLWRYSLIDDKWTWMAGSNIGDQAGVYVEKGNASIDYIPGGRRGAFRWYDNSKKELWFFGG